MLIDGLQLQLKLIDDCDIYASITVELLNLHGISSNFKQKYMLMCFSN